MVIDLITFAKQLEEETLFRRDNSIQWFCTNCGYIHEGKEAPKACPVCQHPQGYFIEFSRSQFGSNYIHKVTSYSFKKTYNE